MGSGTRVTLYSRHIYLGNPTSNCPSLDWIPTSPRLEWIPANLSLGRVPWQASAGFAATVCFLTTQVSGLWHLFEKKFSQIEIGAGTKGADSELLQSFHR